ncbi:MAG: hypothetical protein Q7R97_04390 [Candidatus Daviesbacteria bacterium]|nr:hypothetical protein [Candidatus Daviesbacteria bacterium]
MDQETTVKTYTGSFTLSDNGTIKIKYHSIDNAGNEESPKEKEITINQSSSNSESNNSVSTSTNNSNQDTSNNPNIVANEVKKVLSNILDFGDEEKNNDQISENNDSEVLGIQTEAKNNNIIQNILNFLHKNKFIFIPVIIIGSLIIHKKKLK